MIKSRGTGRLKFLREGDLMEKDWIFTTDGYICELRTAAVFVKENKVLVQRERGGSEYALPGGHVKAGERLEDASLKKITTM